MRKNNILLINVIVVFTISFAAVFYLDGFVRYPISSPDSRIQSSTYGDFAEFDIHAQGLGYETAVVIDQPLGGERSIYLLDKDGELHLVNFEKNPLTGRYRLQDDVLITETSCSVTLKNLFYNATFEIVDGELSNMYLGYGISKFQILSAMYFVTSLLITALETFLLSRFLKRKSRKESAAS